jgi:acyl transferase domain-containing protein
MTDERTEIPDPASAVAIIGMACRLPAAADPVSFWRLLRSGTSAISERPPVSRTADPVTAVDTDAPQFGGYLDQIDQFDPAFFGISPREAAAMDPQQRLMMELSWEALEDARIVPGSLAGSRLGVFVGAILDDYAILTRLRGIQGVTPHTLTGTRRGIIANRVSHHLGVRGPSVVVDTGQSSGLVAVHAAVESIRTGESSLAIAGAVNLNLDPLGTLGVAEFGALSPDGRCFTFDARANGYVRGEGGGAVVLKPLRRALADGDLIYCVVRGCAVNQDGATPTMAQPSAERQADVIRSAYLQAGADASAVQYVELHGTGTRVGDPVEAAGLGAALGAGRSGEAPLLVGSAKTNVGHLEGAAGIVGLLKVALSIHHRELPASLGDIGVRRVVVAYTGKVTSAESLGRILAQARLLAGLSQRELARRLGTTQKYIWELEAGKPSIVMDRLFAAMRETGMELTATITPRSDDG